MKKNFLTLAAIVVIAAGFKPLWAQYTFFTPTGSFAVEVSLENTDRLRLPIYRNAITTLTVVGDFAIGGTSANEGLSPFLFAVSLPKQELVTALDLAEVVPGQRTIQSGFGRVGEALYAGTLPDREGESGHLLKVLYKAGEFVVTDLGAAVPGEGIFALTADSGRRMLYGISHPGGKFFSYEISTGKIKVHEETALNERQRGTLHEYSLEAADVLSRRLAVDKMGRVYGSRPVNAIFRFDPATDKIETLADELPEVWGRRALGRVDCWAVAPNGTIYGGNAGDGQLFKLNPLTGKVVNLGKPIMSPRLKGLAFGKDGKLYGVAGALPGYAHLFTYNPSTGGYKDLGNPRFPLHAPEITGELPWRGFQIGTVAASEKGTYIVLGEEESLSQLMVFPVQ